MWLQVRILPFQVAVTVTERLKALSGTSSPMLCSSPHTLLLASCKVMLSSELGISCRGIGGRCLGEQFCAIDSPTRLVIITVWGCGHPG